MQSAGFSIGENDSVLITARAPPQTPVAAEGGRGGGGGGGGVSCGGSGFVRHGVVLTSGTWLANLLTLKPHSTSSGPDSIPTGIEWELTQPHISFHIVYQTTRDRTHTTLVTKGQNMQWSSSGLGVRKAEVDSVLLLGDVYRCLMCQTRAMGHWRCELHTLPVHGGEGGGGGGGEVGELVTLESLLLPLSCVVVFKVEGLEPRRMRDRRPWYRPRVGDSLLSISTPFATYCPEVFHNSVMSGSVCKLIGRNGSVFLTDACHLPNTEGASLRRDRSPSADVVAMVLSPLFSERGHPTGLSLATSLSSLPPRSPPSPPPHTPPSPLPPSHAGLITQQQSNLTGVCKLVVGVAVGSNWGSGILLSPTRILTCAHVVPKPHSSPVMIYTLSESCSHSGSVLEWNQDMDIAIIGLLGEGIGDCPILEPVWDQIYRRWSRSHSRRPQDCQKGLHNYCGIPVYAIGCECPPSVTSGPMVTRGEVTQVAGWGGEGVMVVSSAVVLPGMSGGVLVSGEDGQLLSMLVSISEDTSTGHTYPTLNYSLSLPWLLPALLPYTLRGEGGDLHRMMSENGERVKHLWTLGRGGGIASKL